MVRDNGRVTELETASSLAYIQGRIAPLQASLNHHPLYAAIRTPQHLRMFMEAHVFAVLGFHVAA